MKSKPCTAIIKRHNKVSFLVIKQDNDIPKISIRIFMSSIRSRPTEPTVYGNAKTILYFGTMNTTIGLPKYNDIPIKLIIRQITKRRPILRLIKASFFLSKRRQGTIIFVSFSKIRKGKHCVSHPNYPFGIAANYRSYWPLH